MMNKKIRKAIVAGLGIAALSGTSFSANAAGAVFQLGVLTSAGFTGSGATPQFSWDGQNNKQTPSGPLVANYGWQHSSDWYVFSVSAASQVEIKMTTPATGINPAFTLWSATNRNIGHAYNQVGITPYFLPSGGTSFVGYANSGPTGWTNGYGLDGSGLGGVVGSGSGGNVTVTKTTATTPGLAGLVIDNLGVGNYLIAVGGSCHPNDATCNAQTTNYNLSIKQLGAPVPIPPAIWLFGSTLAGLGVFGRRKGKNPA